MTEQKKHTPGPWQVVPTPSNKGYIVLGQPHPALRSFTKTIAFVGYKTNAETEADAILITAAPDMLSVLKDALDMASLAETLTGCRGDDDFVADFKAKVEATIAKATQS